MESQGCSLRDEEERDSENIKNAVEYLKNTDKTDKDDSNLWDFLCTLVNKLLSERPGNAYNAMENIVRCLKKEKENEQQEEPSQDVAELTARLESAKLFQNFLTPSADNDASMCKPIQASPWSDVIEQMTLLQRIAGVSMPEKLLVQLALSMRQLLQSRPDIVKARFWGMVHDKFLVVEAELSEAGYTQRREEREAQLETQRQLQAQLETERKAQEGEIEAQDVDITSQQQPSIPAEPPGTGVNRLVYFVSCDPCGPESWHVLPDTTPQHITAARQIVALFSGDLSAPVKSWPPFPGEEACLLRAQLARITASTHVAPGGFFKLRRKRSPSEQLEEEEEEEDEEEDEDEPVEREVVVNTRYQPPPPSSLLQLSAWVHYTPHILQQQARTVWWNPQPPGEQDDEEDEESGSETSGGRGPGAESGPRPFSALSEDRAVPELVPGIPDCFALRSVSCLVPAVVARSLLWPGAVTLAVGRRLEHVYMGSGVKSSSRHRAPLPPPLPAVEPNDLIFTNDPSPMEEAEAARRKAAEQEQDEDEEEGSD